MFCGSVAGEGVLGRMDTCMAESLCCIPDTTTTLLICPQSFPALGSFPVSQLFASGGQKIGALASASILPMNVQD